MRVCWTPPQAASARWIASNVLAKLLVTPPYHFGHYLMLLVPQLGGGLVANPLVYALLAPAMAIAPHRFLAPARLRS